MSLHKLTAGDGYTYLTRQVAALDATAKGQSGLGEYYSQRGESPGRWAGAGLAGLAGMAVGQRVGEEQMKALFGEGRHPDATRIEHETFAAGATGREAIEASCLGRPFPIYDTPGDGFRARCAQVFGEFNAALGFPRDWPVPAADRSRIRTDIGRNMFTVLFGRPPADARELSGFIARAGRPATTAVAGYDLTFSPVKSVSALWALAPRAVAERVEAAHHAAVADTLGWLERQACYTRTGAAGIRQVEVTGLVAAVFTHRDSRAGDPDLHTHVAVSNKVQALDGRWLALDGRVLHKATVAASERYNTRLEAQLVARLGVGFADRPTADLRKRAVREIVGVDERLLTAWSSRRRAIDARRGELAARFQDDYARPPTAIEAIGLAQQATLETRAAKHEPRSLGQQRFAWRREAMTLIGGPPGVDQMVNTTLTRRPGLLPRLTRAWVRDAAGRLLATVSAERATWQLWHVQAEAERLVRGDGIAPGDVEAAVTLLVEEALSPNRSIALGQPDPVDEPAPLRRSDGSSVYTIAGSQLYTSQTVIDAEQLLVAAAGRIGGRAVDEQTVELALLESAANGVELNPGQSQLVRELATSGARVQLAVAPAGSGKTTAMRVLARAWADSGGDVVGLAPSAVAAAGLAEQIGVHCDTLAKLIRSLHAGALPDWVRRIGAGTLVVIDEAGMAGTVDLAHAVRFILDRGGSVRLVGDDRQLAAIAAGGVLRDIADSRGVVTLSQLTRFHDPAEGAATLALRAGDPAGLGFYLDRGRIHVGDQATAADQAYGGWAADRAAGRDSVMLAPTRELVAELNARARADRLLSNAGSVRGREVEVADGNRASAGDLLISRRNDRTLSITSTDWVKNGDRWAVRKVHRSGAVDVTHTDTRRRVTLPAGYVREATELGYACTVHGAQGITAEVCHTVATGQETRQLLYVALTRGRAANHVYLAVAGDGDPHSVITPAAVRPPTATDILTGILGRDGSQRSAATTARELADPATRLHQAAARYRDALSFAAETELGHGGLALLDSAAEQLLNGLSRAPAWPTLRAHLALLAVDGRDPAAALQQAAARELGSAADPAAVLDWRLDPAGGPGRPAGPLPWLPAIPPALADHPQWGRYLTARAEQVTGYAQLVRRQAAAMTPTAAPRWATRLLDPEHDGLRADVTVWRAATGTPANDRRPTGAPQIAAAEQRHQRWLDEAAEAVMGQPNRAAAAWAPLADSIDPRITGDEHWPELADRLAAADRAGLDVACMLTAVADSRPLPDDLPAAALWWRLSAHLAPAAVTATQGSGAATLRPAWTAALLDALPAGRAERVLADPAWPALVAAVNTGGRAGWDPADLIAAAAAGLKQIGDPRLPAADLAGALVFRVAMLTDPAPVNVDEPLPPDLEPPADLHLLDSAPDPTAASPAGTPDDEPPFDPDYDHAPADPSEYATPDPLAWIGRPADADPADYLLEEYRWATAAVPRARLVDLNQQAADFFTDHYPQSWAAGYLTERLGDDLTGDPRYNPGHAPAGWTALTEHLRGRGATDAEIIGAGLGVHARTGNVIDRFRDRLTFPIHGVDGDIHGFIARRNPDRDGNDRAGPKYLNTADTDLFSKGDQLLGLHENRDALTAGATPVLVEGPLDAIAVTLAGAGQYAGVATLGTAFTDRQADQLRPHIGADRTGVVVATDADPAGDTAAERAYWQLTARGDNPRRLAMADGFDPAEVLRRGGVPALGDALDRAGSLAEHLIDRRIAPTAGNSSAEDHAAGIRAAAEIIGALPPQRWLPHIQRVTDVLQAAPGSVHMEVIDAGHAWTLDPTGQARAQLRAGARDHRSASTATEARPKPNTAAVPETAEPLLQRWTELANDIDPRLPAGEDWPLLAGALIRAHAAGYDIAANLPRLGADPPLPHTRPAAEMYWRLLEHCHAAALPTSRQPVLAQPSAHPPARHHPSERPPPLNPDRHPTGPDR